jgi:hypothetical protein
VVVQACNPTYEGGTGLEDRGPRLALGKDCETSSRKLAKAKRG